MAAADNIFALINEVLKSSLEPGAAPQAPKIIVDAAARIGSLTSLSVSSPAEIANWVNAWRALADDELLRQSLLVRVLQIKLPRIAEVLTLLGVIEFLPHVPEGNEDHATFPPHAFQIHWRPGEANRSSVTELFSAATVRQPETWLKFLNSRLGNTPEDVQVNAKLIKALFAVLITSPVELVKLEYGGSGFAGLPKSSGAETPLGPLLDLIRSPLRMALNSDFNPSAGPDQWPTIFRSPAPGENVLAIGLEPAAAVPAGLDRLVGLSCVLEVNDQGKFAGQKLSLPFGWAASLQTSAANAGAYEIAVAAGPSLRVTASDPGRVSLALERVSSDRPAVTLGSPTGTRLTIDQVACLITASKSSPSLRAEFTLKPVTIALDLGGTLIGIAQGPLVQFTSDFSFGLDSQHGFNAPAGTLSFERVIPLGLDLAVVKIPQLSLSVQLALRTDQPAGGGPSRGGFDITLQATVAANLSVGPVKGYAEGAGVKVIWSSAGPGDPLQFNAIPPSRIGLSLNAPPIEGGGFIGLLAEREYAGALSLKLLGFGVSAFGIYKELPGGQPSFIALVGIRFPTPGIQLSWGFALAGVGGLVGVHRRANTDLLRERLSSGAAGNVLFNDNPAANAPALVNDLRAFFPDELGTFVVGPTLQITWGVTLVSLDLGVFIELPGPRKIFLAGSLRVLVGANPELALVFLRMDFVGGVDFTCQLIFFDAALVGSHVMQIFRITGGAALRLNFGDNGFFLLTVGGFHPSFNLGPLSLPQVARAGAYMSADLGIKAWLKLEQYFAVTPNTLQVGAGIEAGLEIGPLQAHGWFRFDALVQFTPFHIVAQIDAGFDVEVEGVSLCGVRIEGVLSGPGPIVISAKASVKILFVRISGHATVQLGSNSSDGRPAAIDNLIEQVALRLRDPQNASVAGQGSDPAVNFKPRDKGGSALVTPLGRVVWDQRVVPLNRDLTRFEGVPLSRPSRLRIEAVNRATARVNGWFSAGTYSGMSESESLNTARFSEEQSGLSIGGAGSVVGVPVTPDISVELHKIMDVGTRLRIGINILCSTSWGGAFADLRRERQGFVAPAALPDGPVAEGKFPRPRSLPDRWRVARPDSAGQIVSPAQAWAEAHREGGVAVHATSRSIDLTGVLG